MLVVVRLADTSEATLNRVRVAGAMITHVSAMYRTAMAYISSLQLGAIAAAALKSDK